MDQEKIECFYAVSDLSFLQFVFPSYCSGLSENKYFLLAYGYVHVQNFYDDEYGEVRRNKRNRNKQYADNKLREKQEMRKMLGLDLKPKEKQHIKNVDRIERKQNKGE